MEIRWKQQAACRIFGLCLQRAYDTGTLPYLEDFEMSLTPVGAGRRLSNSSGLDARLLAILDRNQAGQGDEWTPVKLMLVLCRLHPWTVQWV